MVHVIQSDISSTLLITALITTLLVTARRRNDNGGLTPRVTQEIKGLAVLMIIISHIGFFLADDRSFLYPLSIMAGVGVNLFLLLSGYGLTLSQSAKPLRRLDWYRKRLPKLYIPMMLVVLGVVLLDFLLAGRTYSLGYIVRSLMGWFPNADIAMDINSPLWYFSFIIFNYLLFPLLFIRRKAWLTAIGIFIVSMLLVDVARRTGLGITPLYRTHIAAFPLGILLAWLITTNQFKTATTHVKSIARRTVSVRWQQTTINWLMVLLLLLWNGYLAKHSGVGSGPIQEQFVSLVSTLSIILLFIVKRFELRFLAFIGFFSYELYLLHWPLLSRHDFLYSWLPGWAATIIWLGVLIGLSWSLQRLSGWLPKIWQRRQRHTS